MLKIKLADLLSKKNQNIYWLEREAKVPFAVLLPLAKGQADSLNLIALENICTALECQPSDIFEVVPNEARDSGSQPKPRAHQAE